MNLSREQLELIGKAAGKEALNELLTTLGVDIKRPIEIQRDFAFLRNMRLGTANGARWAIKGIITAIGTAIGGWLWYTLRTH